MVLLDVEGGQEVEVGAEAEGGVRPWTRPSRSIVRTCWSLRSFLLPALGPRSGPWPVKEKQSQLLGEDSRGVPLLDQARGQSAVPTELVEPRVFFSPVLTQPLLKPSTDGPQGHSQPHVGIVSCL